MREMRKLKRYSPYNFRANFSLYITDDDPITVREVVNLEDSKLWKKVMVEEMEVLDNNEAWDLFEFRIGIKAIGSKWVFNKKLNAKGKMEKYKAWLVEKGYSQVEGIDFGEIFSLVAKLASIIFLLYVVATLDFEVE
jgi:hypothetical protein